MLVYEPNLIQRKLIEVVMRDLALRVFQVESVAEAGQLIAIEPIDVVIVDVDSGVRAGDTEERMELVERVVAVGTPVIIVTAAAVHGELDQVRRLGATAVLTKPYQPTVLRDAVEIATRTVSGPAHGVEKHTSRSPRAIRKTRVSSAFVSRVRSALERGRDEGGTAHDELQDRLTDSKSSTSDEPSAADVAEGSTDVVNYRPGHLNRVALVWTILGVGSVVAGVDHGYSHPNLFALIMITSITVGFTTWNSMLPGRLAYDPTLPLKVALGVATGPITAPLALAALGVVCGIANGFATKAPWKTSATNAGVLSLEGVLLGYGVGFAMEWANRGGGLGVLALGLAVAIGTTIVFNFGSVFVTLKYLTGSSAALTKDIGIQFAYDLGSGVAIGIVMWMIGDPIEIALIALVGYGAFGAMRLRAVVSFQHQTFFDIASIVEEFERRSVPLSDHTANVAKIVTAMTNRWSRTEQQRAVAAAWFHTLSLGGEVDRCSGGAVPEVLEQVRHLPRRWRIESNIAAAAEKRHWAAAEGLDVPGLVGLACAVDSLRLANGQLRTLRDIQLVWGFPARAIYDATFLATDDEGPDDGGADWSPNLRPNPA